MSITIHKYKKEDLDNWENFIVVANNGTLFHKRQFINYHPKGKFIDHSLIFKKKGNIICVLPATIVKTNNAKMLISHPGTSIGSFVIKEQLSFKDSIEIVKRLSEYSSSLHLDSIKLIQPPQVYYKYPTNYIDFSLRKEGYSYLNRELSSYIKLNNNIDDILLRFKSTHRTALRKAEKSGVQITISEQFGKFYKILKNNLSKRHNVQPTHKLNEIQKLKTMFPEKIFLFAAYLNNKIIAGVIIFILNDRVVLAFYISHDKKYEALRPLNLLMYSIITWCIDKKYKIFDFGTFTLNEKPNLGLARFKEYFGAAGIFRDSLEKRL